MTTAIRTPLVVRRAGERPTKSSLTSPVYALPACSPLWRAFVHLAYPYAKNARRLPLCRRWSTCAGSACSERAPHQDQLRNVLASGFMCGSAQYPRPHTLLCQQNICHFHTRFKLLLRPEREGMHNFLGHKVVPLAQQPCPWRGLEALGRVTDA